MITYLALGIFLAGAFALARSSSLPRRLRDADRRRTPR
jgi:hypothetical protein